MLQDFGWNHAIGIDKPKGSVMVGIGLVQDTNIIYTIESKGIDSDFKNYQYAKDRLGVVDDEVVKLNDDFADNIRYVRRHIRNIGLG
jgi:phage terminase large subunit